MNTLLSSSTVPKYRNITHARRLDVLKFLENEHTIKEIAQKVNTNYQAAYQDVNELFAAGYISNGTQRLDQRSQHHIITSNTYKISSLGLNYLKNYKDPAVVEVKVANNDVESNLLAALRQYNQAFTLDDKKKNKDKLSGLRKKLVKMSEHFEDILSYMHEWEKNL